MYLESSSIVPREEMATSLAAGRDALHPHQKDCESSFQQHSFEEEISRAPTLAGFQDLLTITGKNCVLKLHPNQS